MFTGAAPPFLKKAINRSIRFCVIKGTLRSRMSEKKTRRNKNKTAFFLILRRLNTLIIGFCRTIFLSLFKVQTILYYNFHFLSNSGVIVDIKKFMLYL